ncbi:hypothetical protein Ae201684P_011810 [Aphanomyces euteiches]|nr:hypothetical protein Ae201684P_011810 [Aphanomyces euteiches]
MVDQPDGTQKYSENKADVTAALQNLLNNWIPLAERTERPAHLSTLSPTELPQAPRFVRDWLLHDMHRPEHIAPGFLHEDQCTWDTYVYSPDMQQHCDRYLRKHVAPGYGGVSQELWIAAPPVIRERERLIIKTILRTGCVPPCLGRKQMLYLAKSDTAHGIVNLDPGLPPWRPITVQSAFTSRLFMVRRDYIAPIIPNEPLQHGFQKDRTVQDAVILTSLLIDRAQRTNSELFLTSKDCLKCFDRVPSWVMEYVYLKLGVPPTPRKLMAHFLGASQIDIRTAFDWDITWTFSNSNNNAGLIQSHSSTTNTQGQTHRSIGSLLFVDDALDIATTYAGIQHRATTSNIFTGKYASGGVFGAEKSFMLYLSPTHHPAISLNNGLGEPQPVKILAPMEGFKHLGIHQGAGVQWAANTQALWHRLKRQAEQIAPKRLTGAEFRYIVNAPNESYNCRMTIPLSGSMTIWMGSASRTVNTSVEAKGHVLRIANDIGSPAYDALMDAMETYQLQMGLTDHPLASPIPPPTTDQSFLGTTLRIAAAMTHHYTIHATWKSPSQCISTRPFDQSIWQHLTPHLSTKLLQINKAARLKVRWLGDITNERGNQLLSLDTLRLRFGWTAQQLATFEPIWSEIPLAPQPSRYTLRQSTIPWINGPPPQDDLPPATSRQRLNPLPLLLNPLGRARSIQAQGIHTIHIPLGALLIIPILLTSPGQPDVLSYQIGRRDSLQTRIAPTGTEMAVTYWYEQRKGSGIWYAPSKRELCRSTRLTQLSRCFPAAGNPIPTSTPGRAKFLVWTDTVWTDMSTRRTYTGENDRSCIAATWDQDRTYEATYHATGRPPDLSHRCTECLRHLATGPCTNCQQYHHPECLRCAVQPATPPEATRQPFPCGTHQSDPILQAVGDGSVLRAGTATASGSWCVILPSSQDPAHSTSTQGRLDVTPLDLTSTRCESHGMIYGLHISGDRNTQICDNQAAIGLPLKARDLKRKALVPKYRDPHRVELRSFMRLLTPEGSFRGLWVRSHQENATSDDPVLNQRSIALARADALAATAHSATLTQSYASLLQRDAWELRDHNGKPIFGNTGRWLHNLQQHSTWAARQALSGHPARHTMVDDRTSTPKLCG